MNSRMSEVHYTGCLLGGACGDAMGWPVEFESLERIRQLTDWDGVTEMTPGKDGLYEITDDTQMTLFTAEGLLRGLTSARVAGSPPDFVAALKRSYLCWLATQGERGSEVFPKGEEAGWLLAVEGLHQRRGPGNTCLSALRGMRFSGRAIAANGSKGCGGIMRAAPAGLLAARLEAGNTARTASLAFELGWQAAAITHGDPSGYFPAGVLAAVIACVVRGESITQGVERSLVLLESHKDSEETIGALQASLKLAQDRSQAPSPETVETLGAGWIGSEALAIGLYCALVAGDDLARGVRLAVNHSGDSDSTGSIAGNLLGAQLGEGAIPARWLEHLELAEVIRQVAVDLRAGEGPAGWLKKYPPV
jgi:ADP-ribosyl-[dinitrogen reductase] hydrolase